MMEKIKEKIEGYNYLITLLTILGSIVGIVELFQVEIRRLWNTQIPSLILVVAVIVLFVICLFVFRGQGSNKDFEMTIKTTIKTEGEFLVRFQRLLVEAKSEIIICGLEEFWIFPLLISLVIARSKNVKVKVINFKDFRERYRLLQYLGCEVFMCSGVQDEDRFACVLMDPTDVRGGRAIAYSLRRREKDNIFGRYYLNYIDYYTIVGLYNHVNSLINSGSCRSLGVVDHKPRFQRYQDALLIGKMKKCRFYQGADIKIEEVNVNKIVPLSRYIYKYKLSQLNDFLGYYKERGWAYFTSIGITLSNGKVSPIVPPVVEQRNGKYYIVEGHTRIYKMRELGERRIRAVVVRNVNEPFPSSPTKWKKISVDYDKHQERNPEYARYIESGVHKGIWSNEI